MTSVWPVRLTPIRTSSKLTRVARALEHYAGGAVYYKAFHYAYCSGTVWRDDVNPATLRAAVLKAIKSGDYAALDENIAKLRELATPGVKQFNADMLVVAQRMVLDHYAKALLGATRKAADAQADAQAAHPDAPDAPDAQAVCVSECYREHVYYVFDEYLSYMPQLGGDVVNFDQYAERLRSFLVATFEAMCGKIVKDAVRSKK